MPEFQKRNLPYVQGNTLIIPADANERYRYWDYDWEGQSGMSTIELLKGLDREDLIPSYDFGDTSERYIPTLEKAEPVKVKPEIIKKDGSLF